MERTVEGSCSRLQESELPHGFCCSQLKTLLRKTGERTRDGLWHAIARILRHYSPDECRNLFTNAGYAT